MKFPLEQHREALEQICRQYKVRRLEVFGSAATGEGYDPDRSDLDFLVEFETGVDLGPWMKLYFEFKAALEDLFQCPVDVVMASALKSRFFIREVNRTRKTLYAA